MVQQHSLIQHGIGIPSQWGRTGQLQGCWKGAAPSPGPLKFGGFQAERSNGGLAPRRVREGGAGRRGNLACRGGRLGHAPGMSPSTSHRQLRAAAPSCPPPASWEGGLWTPTTSQLGESTVRASITLTVQPRGPPCHPARLPSKPRGHKMGQGEELATRYLLLTCPEGFGVGDGCASPPGCVSQGERAAGRQLLCAGGDTSQHPPVLLPPKPHPCRKRKQSITSG